MKNIHLLKKLYIFKKEINKSYRISICRVEQRGG